MKKTLIALGLAACLLGAMAACSPQNQESMDFDPAASVQENVTTPELAEENEADTTPSTPDVAETVPAEQNETDTAPAEPDAVSNASADPYQGLSQEQWQLLQDQKELYADASDEMLSEAVFNGDIECENFIHLYWEDGIEGHLVRYVGSDEFNAWTINRAYDGLCTDIYSFAEHFSIELDELVSIINENNLTHIYDVATLERRYAYFNG